MEITAGISPILKISGETIAGTYLQKLTKINGINIKALNSLGKKGLLRNGESLPAGIKIMDKQI